MMPRGTCRDCRMTRCTTCRREVSERIDSVKRGATLKVRARKQEKRAGGLRRFLLPAGFNDRYASVTHKILYIQGEQVRHAVNTHGGYETSVMDLHAENSVGHDQASPLVVNQ